MSLDSLGMTMEGNDSVVLWASRSREWAFLVLRSGDTSCEIRMDRVHVEALRDHIPVVLAGLDRWAVQDAACAQAVVAGRRAADVAAQALDRAVAADTAGAPDVAASLRAAAADVTAKANAVDAAVEAFGLAAEDADSAADSVIFHLRQADTALPRSRV